MEFQLVDVREVMRRWVTGVAILTTGFEGGYQGMTVSSFTSVSIVPPVVTVTLENSTRTRIMLEKTGYFCVNLLPEDKEEISDRFAGRVGDQENRFKGIDIFSIQNGVPLLMNAMAHLVCRVIHRYELPLSTLYMGEVLSSTKGEDRSPLCFFNRKYRRLEE